MKYLIKFNIGYGDEVSVAEAETQDEAHKKAREAWQDAVEGSADYTAEILTEELAEDYGLEDELD